MLKGLFAFLYSLSGSNNCNRLERRIKQHIYKDIRLPVVVDIAMFLFFFFSIVKERDNDFLTIREERMRKMGKAFTQSQKDFLCRD